MPRHFVKAAVLLVLAVPMFAQRLPQTATPQHYKIALAPDFDTEKFAGDETIDVAVTKPGTTLVLNAAEITFGKVTITQNGATQDASAAPDEKLQQATLTVAKPLTAGAAQVHITYTGILNKQLRGFYLSQTKARKYAVSQFEATDARRAFPGWDEPAYKATFDVTAVINTGDMAISNTKVLSDSAGVPQDLAAKLSLTAATAKHTVTFATTPKMSSYLVALAVGDWACVAGEQDGIPIRICSVPENKDRLAFTLEAAQHILQFYNRFYAIKYPYGKLDVLGTPDFAAGAMENTAAIFARDVLVSLDPNTASEGQRHQVALVLAHEMAHQWFGDLVTMRWWDDVWLNEGFATWMETKPLIAWHPEWHDDLDEIAGTEDSKNGDANSATRPIHQHADTPDEINELFDGIAYGKAAAVLRMIQSYLGPDEFRNGVNHYLDRFKWSNASAADFWNAMTEATHKPVDQIMPGFINQAGVPLVTVGACSGNKLSVEQKRYFADPKQFEKPSEELWHIPVCLKSPSGGPPSCEVISTRQASVAAPSCAGPIFPNAGAQGYYIAGYSGEQARALAGSSLNPGEQIDLLNSEWAMVDVNRASVGDFLNIAQNFQSSRTPQVVGAISGRVFETYDYLTDDADRDKFTQWVKAWAGPLYRELGWRPLPGETPERGQLRNGAIGAMAYIVHDPQVISSARQMALQYLEDPSSLPPSMAGTILSVAALSNDPALYDKYMAALKNEKEGGSYYRLFFALAQFTDAALLQRTLQFAISPEVRSQDAAQLIANAFQDTRGRNVTWDFIRKNWDEVAKHLPPFEGGVTVVGSTGSFCDAEHAQQVQQFFTEHPVQGAERTLKQVLDHIHQCIELRDAQQPKLAQWLREKPVAAGGQQ